MRKFSNPSALTLLFLTLLMSIAAGWAETSRADTVVLPATASRELALRYYFLIARGHLYSSIELARIGRLDHSVIHSRHGLDEAWIELARILPAGEAQALREKIEAVNEAVALKSALPGILAANDELNAYLEKLDQGLLRNGISRHRQKLDVLVLLLREALAEYEVAWNGLQLENHVEYQDGYGFVSIARSELHGIMPEMNTENPAATAEIEKSIEQMAHAWPSPEPPGKPAMSKAVLRALVTAVELNARRFAR
jgi:hypothetical protein